MIGVKVQRGNVFQCNIEMIALNYCNLRQPNIIRTRAHILYSFSIDIEPNQSDIKVTIDLHKITDFPSVPTL